MPPRWAARTFSLSPPIGSTLPRSVISPVIAMSLRTLTRHRADTSAVAKRDSGRRAVLWNRALGDVNVDVDLLVEVRGQAQLLRTRADV